MTFNGGMTTEQKTLKLHDHKANRLNERTKVVLLPKASKPNKHSL